MKDTQAISYLLENDQEHKVTFPVSTLGKTKPTKHNNLVVTTWEKAMEMKKKIELNWKTFQQQHQCWMEEASSENRY